MHDRGNETKREKDTAKRGYRRCGSFFREKGWKMEETGRRRIFPRKRRHTRHDHQVSYARYGGNVGGKICRADMSLARFIEKCRGDAPSGQSFCELLTTRSCIRCTRCIHTHTCDHLVAYCTNGNEGICMTERTLACNSISRINFVARSNVHTPLRFSFFPFFLFFFPFSARSCAFCNDSRND